MPSRPARHGTPHRHRPATVTVRLRPGDTLWALARADHTTVRTLQRLNHLGSSTLIRAGAVLRLPASTARRSSAPSVRPDRVAATNPSSGVYGLPQSLPGSKMAAFGTDWRTDPATRLRWMRTYVTARYGSACKAWAFRQTHRWY
ncbi:LysM domain-containing protein [Streptomyces sp. HPF1205]|uniref:LysM peptidoglycan-binding domain-containing protein n=1 Tax=Streptomyces sp. HPF1205 TaxID=2873262 RepID=UPI0027E11958|nr:LysM domain-containing protein [Streptomyces sp. HPF1205]